MKYLCYVYITVKSLTTNLTNGSYWHAYYWEFYETWLNKQPWWLLVTEDWEDMYFLAIASVKANQDLDHIYNGLKNVQSTHISKSFRCEMFCLKEEGFDDKEDDEPLPFGDAIARTGK